MKTCPNGEPCLVPSCLLAGRMACAKDARFTFPNKAVYYVRFRANERWYGIDAIVPNQTQRLRAYGRTPTLAEERLHEILLAFYPTKDYFLIPLSGSKNLQIEGFPK